MDSLSLVLMKLFVLSKKKKRKSQKVPAETAGAHGPGVVHPPGTLPPSVVWTLSPSHTDPAALVLSSHSDTSGVSSLSLAQRIPFPVFPLRASLAPLAPPGPVQAAAPPAEYHSDSAESLEEMPVVLAKLGSSLTVVDSSRSSLRTVPAFPPQSPPHPRTKRKASSSRSNRSAGELMFALSSSHPPAVFVSRASGDPALTRQDDGRAGHRETDLL